MLPATLCGVSRVQILGTEKGMQAVGQRRSRALAVSLVLERGLVAQHAVRGGTRESRRRTNAVHLFVVVVVGWLMFSTLSAVVFAVYLVGAGRMEATLPLLAGWGMWFQRSGCSPFRHVSHFVWLIRAISSSCTTAKRPVGPARAVHQALEVFGWKASGNFV